MQGLTSIKNNKIDNVNEVGPYFIHNLFILVCVIFCKLSFFSFDLLPACSIIMIFIQVITSELFHKIEGAICCWSRRCESLHEAEVYIPEHAWALLI